MLFFQFPQSEARMSDNDVVKVAVVLLCERLGITQGMLEQKYKEVLGKSFKDSVPETTDVGEIQTTDHYNCYPSMKPIMVYGRRIDYLKGRRDEDNS